ncbi:MAG: sodium/proton-translocating pyrophosphatase, partial [Bacteroidales bacterium]|nr:sodium/proton-translocating pyrophosphatase [Bacteroidales bacterium]
MNSLIYFVLAASVLALVMAFVFYKQMLSKDEGTDLMKKIAAHVRKGAMAYLKQQYKVVTIVFVILAALFAIMAFFDLQNGWVWFAFLTGGLFSGLAGFFGMKTATYASARTANAARKSLNSG